jgi:hypothetical protein
MFLRNSWLIALLFRNIELLQMSIEWLGKSSTTRFSTTTQIETKGEKPSGRAGHTAVLFDQRYIAIFGGFNGEDEYFNETFVLDTSKDIQLIPCSLPLVSSTWTKLKTENTPQKRRGHTMTSVTNNSFIVIGGENDGDPLNDVWLLRISSKDTSFELHWERIKTKQGTNMPEVYGHTATRVSENMIMVVGGHSDSRILKSLRWIELSKVI